ncbi:hypothetical protein EON62_02295 [archaeon]|nr:MAG: hypothetical protein EON62_02295 [archaeon]
MRFSDKVHVTLVPPKSEPNSENDAHAHRDEDEGRLFDHASSMHGEGEDEGEGEGGVQLGMPRVLEAHDEEREYDDDDDDEEDEEAHIVNEHTVFDDSPGMRGQSSDARTSPVFDRRLVRNTAAVSHLRVWTGEEGGTEGAKHHADGVGVIADASGSAAKPKSWALWASVLK